MQDMTLGEPPVVGPPTTPGGLEAVRPARGRALFVVGAVGAILLTIASMWAVISMLGRGFYYYSGYDPTGFLVSSVLIFAGIIVHSFAFVGFYAHHKSQMGMATFITVIVTSTLYIVFMFLAPRTGGWYPYYYIDWMFVWVGSIVLGVGVIVMGASHIVARHYLAVPGLYMASGVIYIISGSFLISFILGWFLPVGWILMFVGALLSTLALFLAFPHLHKIPIRRPPVVFVPQPMAYQPPGLGSRFCPGCGGRIDGDLFCPHCGRRTSP